MRKLLPGILAPLPPALLMVVGFAAGGVAVSLAAGLLSRIPAPGLDAPPSHGSPSQAVTRIPRPTAATRRADGRSRPTARDTVRSGTAGTINADSLALLVEVLRERDLEVPVEGMDADDLRDDFADPRPGGRTHEALDILAPRGTPVVAVEDGTIASLDPSQGGGGIVVYQFDPTGEFIYYYAHLDEFADGLTEGRAVKKGEVLGFVGTTGNAPSGTPHLHFAIAKTPAPYRHYGGIPINPIDVLD